MATITIHARSLDNGATCKAEFQLARWQMLSPVSRVLAIHEQCRATLNGNRFEVIRETVTQ